MTSIQLFSRSTQFSLLTVNTSLLQATASRASWFTIASNHSFTSCCFTCAQQASQYTWLNSACPHNPHQSTSPQQLCIHVGACAVLATHGHTFLRWLGLGHNTNLVALATMWRLLSRFRRQSKAQGSMHHRCCNNTCHLAAPHR